jgi:hypothetical protein
MSMFGQWRGWIKGTNNGELLLNVDRDRPTRGRIQVADGVAPFIADVAISVSGMIVTGQLSNVVAFPPLSGKTYPTTGTITGTITGNQLAGVWTTDTPSSGTFSLMEVEVQPAMAATMQHSWDQFVTWARSKAGDADLIFRGQSSATYPLTTTFHRAGRRDMVRYVNEDVLSLKRSVEAATASAFQLDRDDDKGTLLNIAQHHGFPTPLLDFTHSAFVAAYFAFSGVRARREKDENAFVRVFALDGSVLPDTVPILNIKPTLGKLLLGARMNPRVLPQQSVSIFSDVPDVEGWIDMVSQTVGRKLLSAIDLPASDAPIALRDLRRFGISQASLFPGLDGACKGLAEELFQ